MDVGVAAGVEAGGAAVGVDAGGVAVGAAVGTTARGAGVGAGPGVSPQAENKATATTDSTATMTRMKPLRRKWMPAAAMIAWRLAMDVSIPARLS